jgi:hypothetical protein
VCRLTDAQQSIDERAQERAQSQMSAYEAKIRAQAKVSGEWQLLALAYNRKRCAACAGSKAKEPSPPPASTYSGPAQDHFPNLLHRSFQHPILHGFRFGLN